MGDAYRHEEWSKEYLIAALALAPLTGRFEWAHGEEYVAFRFIAPTFRMVFYPHKTSAGNLHIRVRPEGKVCNQYDEARQLLRSAVGYTCTFSQKNGCGFEADASGSWAGLTGHPFTMTKRATRLMMSLCHRESEAA